jgi:hypothetical protein
MRAVLDTTNAYVTTAGVIADATCENYQIRVRLSNDGSSPAGPTRLADANPTYMGSWLANPIAAGSAPWAGSGTPSPTRR